MIAALGLLTACTASPAQVGDDPSVPQTEPITVPDEGDAATVVPLARGGEYDITQSGLTISIHCDGGGDVDIDANDVTVDITGNCEDIDVDGNNNVVRAENVDEVEIEGSGNSVTVLAVREIEVEGSGNTVTYTSGNPVIENEGDNTISEG